MSLEDNSSSSKISSGDEAYNNKVYTGAGKSSGRNDLVNRGKSNTKPIRANDNTEEDLNSPQENTNVDMRPRAYSRSEVVQTAEGGSGEDLDSLHQILPEDSNIAHPSVDIEKTRLDTLNTRISEAKGTRVFKEIKLLSILTFFAILGVLARKGLMVLTTYSGAFVGGVIWANFTACVVMGMLIQSQRAWKEYAPKATIALYTGLSTGFCGTLSSFSSLILEAFVKSADVSIGKYYHYPNGAYGIMECASVVITQMCVSIAGLHFGKHLIKLYDPKIPHMKLIEDLAAVCGILAWIAVICLIAIMDWRSWTFSCIVAPIGCWTRFYVSKLLNPKFKRFPLGTFTCNVFATLVLAMLNLLSRGKLPNGGRILNSVLACQMIQGLDDGFCGALSTVSTFVVELYTIKSPNSYKYGFVSLAVSYIGMLLILGSYNWTQGLTDPLCS